MRNITDAIKFFNEENFLMAENIALENFFSNTANNDALDVLSAIYIRTNHLNFFNKAGKQELNLIRQIAAFLENLKMFEQAADFYLKSLEIEPNDIVALNNLGLIFETLNKPNEALNYYKKSINLSSNYPALYNIGVLYRKMKNLELSEKYLLKALSINSENQYANYSLGMTYFMKQDFEHGYPYFLKRPVKNIECLKNFWDGKTYKDKTILVYCEYGFGDAIMFSRYLNALEKYFAHVIVYTKSNLTTLFKNSFHNIEFVTTIDVDYDYSVLSMNLPYYLKLNFKNIPKSEGYLIADENKVNTFKEKYFNNTNLKVGIFYIGGELTKRNARYRSIKLSNLEKLFSIPNTKFYSFQKEDIFNELDNYSNIIDLGKNFNDFSDTASAMMNLDIMVSIDSAPIHLAGALGVKSYLLLPYYSEWRWFTDENKTPWYDSVNLIRQKTPCDWSGVVDNLYSQIYE